MSQSIAPMDPPVRDFCDCLRYRACHHCITTNSTRKHHCLCTHNYADRRYEADPHGEPARPGSCESDSPEPPVFTTLAQVLRAEPFHNHEQEVAIAAGWPKFPPGVNPEPLYNRLTSDEKLDCTPLHPHNKTPAPASPESWDTPVESSWETPLTPPPEGWETPDNSPWETPVESNYQSPSSPDYEDVEWQYWSAPPGPTLSHDLPGILDTIGRSNQASARDLLAKVSGEFPALLQDALALLRSVAAKQTSQLTAVQAPCPLVVVPQRKRQAESPLERKSKRRCFQQRRRLPLRQDQMGDYCMSPSLESPSYLPAMPWAAGCGWTSGFSSPAGFQGYYPTPVSSYGGGDWGYDDSVEMEYDDEIE
ncbi:hypothetical protein BJ508DRAFT_378467 [Ascobolus immersus RN42]|uniref:Uncharacterized protein n=1 Tax=Ascobolus immersus RN42 TaxID=1160509 RepID=A0A3N4I225_ASCIM|nr:hypothetical protein BJ508DRAFT_378467 [Ascobolus immersus RN42]